MPRSNFKKIRKQIAEAKVYDDFVTKAQGNLSEANEVARFQLEPNSRIFNDYDTSDAYKTLQNVKENISGPNAPANYPQHRRALRDVNKNVLPDLVRRSEMMNMLNLDDSVQKKAISNDLINKRVATGKIYDFPELKIPAVRHSENDFIDNIARKEAAKKMEQEGISKVLSSYLDAKKGALGVLKTAGKTGLRALPFIGAAADIAMTPEAGEGKGSLAERSFQKPEGSQLTAEELKKLLKGE